MKVCGIISEYDPFHNGHAWQIEKARQQSGADFIICAMSMSFTQRGMPSLLCAHDRAEMALRCGADIVLGVPTLFSVCDAERFALGGVEIFRRIGAVTDISFGVEEEGLPYIHAAAELLENPTFDYQEKLLSGIREGLSFPKAQGLALSACLHAEERVFSLPNTTLAICYLRSALRQKAAFSFHPVIRHGEYHAAEMPEQNSAFPSATAIRAAFEAGNLTAVEKGLPAASFSILKHAIAENRVQKYTLLDPLLRWKLRNDDFSTLPDLSEGIENRFRDASQATSRNEMVLAVKTKRYPYARISRLFAHLLLETKATDVPSLPEYAYLLGFRKTAAPLVHQLSKTDFPLYHRLPGTFLTPSQQIDRKADELWSLGANQPFGSLYRAKPVIIQDM